MLLRRATIRFHAFVLVLFALVQGCATSLPEQRFTPAGTMIFPDAATRRETVRARIPQIEALANEAIEKHGIPTLAVGIVLDGELVYSRNADTIFRIGSITKTFTATAVLKLRDEGQLDLDAPAERYLPELARLTYPSRDSPRITLRHLLTHSSGLPAIGTFSYAQADHDVTEAEILNSLSGVVLETLPGTQFSYSNLGMGLVGVIIGRVTGGTYRDYVSRELLTPLDMSATVWSDRDVPPDKLALAHHAGKVVPHWRLGASESAGGLYSSLKDLARYAAFQLAAHPPQDEPDHGPVRRASLREAHRPNADGVGLAWQLIKGRIAHDGGTEGHSASLQLLPERGVAVIVLSNLHEVESHVPELAIALAQLMADATAPRSFEVTAQMRAAAKTLSDLYAAFSPELYARTFTPTFRTAATPEIVEHSQQQLRVAHGACSGPGKISMTGARAATIAVTCERGAVAYEVSLTVDGLIADASVH